MSVKFEKLFNESLIDARKRWADYLEKEYLIQLLERCRGNVSQAAREVKLERSNFLRTLRKHGIKSRSFRK